MISLVEGDLLKDDADVLVNPVNIVGVMGKELALQFKRAFPDNFSAYQRACKQNALQPGGVLATAIPGDRWIVNLPTKRHWRQASHIEDVAAGLDGLVRFLNGTPIDSVAVPPLGAGHGGLPWPAVRGLITDKLTPVDITVRLYQPGAV